MTKVILHERKSKCQIAWFVCDIWLQCFVASRCFCFYLEQYWQLDWPLDVTWNLLSTVGHLNNKLLLCFAIFFVFIAYFNYFFYYRYGTMGKPVDCASCGDKTPKLLINTFSRADPVQIALPRDILVTNTEHILHDNAHLLRFRLSQALSQPQKCARHWCQMVKWLWNYNQTPTPKPIKVDHSLEYFPFMAKQTRARIFVLATWLELWTSASIVVTTASELVWLVGFNMLLVHHQCSFGLKTLVELEWLHFFVHFHLFVKHSWLLIHFTTVNLIGYIWQFIQLNRSMKVRLALDCDWR